MSRSTMRSYSFEIIFITCLPIQVLNISLKFEGLIDLGPKWDYVYKLSTINKDIFDGKEISLKASKKNENSKEDDKEISDSDDLKTDSEISTSIDIPNVYKGSLRNELSLELQHDAIDKELNIKQVKTENVEKSISKKEKKSKKRHKTTRKLGLRNTYMSFDNFKRNSKEHLQISTEIEKDKSFEANNEKSDFQHGKNAKTHKKDSGKKKKNAKSLLRVNLDEHKVKNNTKIKEFMLHIFKQSLKVFDKIKNLTDDVRIKHKIQLLKDSYIEKFSEFLKESEDHKLRTKLANQNVILNTIDRSHNILRRLVNYLSGDIQKEFNIQTNSGLINLFERELQTGKLIEDKHACKKLSICRTNNEFSDFIIDILAIILEANNAKVTQAANSLTEIIKTNDLTDVMDYETQSKLRKLMTDIESWEPFFIRAMFSMIKNVIVHKNQPITIMEKVDVKLANRTVSFYNLIDILNKNMGTVENKAEWKIVKENLEEWRDDKRKDVQNILERVIRQILNELDNLDYDKKKDVSDLMKVLVNSRT